MERKELVRMWTQVCFDYSELQDSSQVDRVLEFGRRVSEVTKIEEGRYWLSRFRACVRALFSEARLRLETKAMEPMAESCRTYMNVSDPAKGDL